MSRVLLIGGTDSSGGAGLTRDAAVARDHRCQAKPVVTCVTAQSNARVHQISAIPDEVIHAQINAAFADSAPKAVKIGMIGPKSTANAIADALKSRKIPIIFDPVLKSSSGGTLSDEPSLAPVLAITDLLTPNLVEAARLSQSQIALTEDEVAQQAAALRHLGAQAVLIKGGHGQGDDCCDHLFGANGQYKFCTPRLAVERRGTGCTLATAIACGVAQGLEIRTACAQAKTYLQGWLTSAAHGAD